MAARLRRIETEWAETVAHTDRIPVVPFNTMSQWGADGRIVQDAPVHSPFIRRRAELTLE